MHRVLLFGLAALTLTLTFPTAMAVDCPALRFTDHASQLQGEEVLSNTAPLEFGVRLTWENPVDIKPIRTHIYRKESGKAFVKIGQTSSGTQTSYIDKTINKTVPAYAYLLSSEYVCGGKMWSSPAVVLTNRRGMDDTEPLIQYILPENAESMDANEDAYLYIRDIESGVAEKTIRIKRGTTTIPAGSNLGTPQHALFKFNGNLLGTADKDKTITVTVSNGADMNSEKTIDLTKAASNISVTWSTPAGSLVDPRMPLSLGWTISGVSAPEAEKVRLAYSTDFGTDWQEIAVTEKGTGITIQDPQATFSGLKGTSLLWLRLSYEEEGKTYTKALLPLFVGHTTIRFTSPADTIYTPQGSFSIYDALKSTKLSFSAETPYATTGTDRTSLTMQQQEAIVALKPGFYGIEEYTNSFIIPATEDVPNTIMVQPGASVIPVSLYSYLRSVSELRPLTEEENAIIENRMEPAILRAAKEAYDTKKSIKAVDPVILTEPKPQTIPMNASITLCEEVGPCTLTQLLGTSPLKFLWKKDSGTFSGINGSGSKLEPSSPILPRMLTITTQDLSIHIPAKVMTQMMWSPEEAMQAALTSAGVRWDFPANFLKEIEANTGFIKVSLTLKTGQICTDVLLQRRDISGNIVPLPTLCASDRIVAVVLPFAQTELQSTLTAGDVPVLQGSEWFVPYMNQFQLWGMLYQRGDISKGPEFITRGELAYLLHKAFQYPTAKYQAEVRYTDLPADHRFAPYMLGMVAYRIMSGDSDSLTMRPEGVINRAEALKMILTAAHLQNSLPSHLFTGQSLTYKDVAENAWYAAYIRQATNLGLVKGYNENGVSLFRPERQVSRAEAIKMIYTALEKKALE